jgi:hypothetical protein
MQRVRVLLGLCLFLSLQQIACQAQETIIKKQQNLAETVPIAKTIELKVGEVLRLKLPSKPPDKIAIFLGDIDITSQVKIEGDEVVYRSSLVPMSVGEQTLTIYKIQSIGRWDPIATFRIKVEPAIAQAVIAPVDPQRPSATTPANPSPSIPATQPAPKPSIGQPASPSITAPATATPAGTNIAFAPKFSINLKSQVLENRSLDAGISQRPTFFTADFTGGLSTENQIGNTKLKTKFTVVGTTFQPESLRFSELQERASQIDLSEYAIETNDGNNQFAVGNLCFGNHPFLLNNLCTRGISAKAKLNEFSDLSAARISSTGIVGFDNIFGLGRGDNILDSVVLGFQVAKNQGSGVRVETTWINGSRAPVANFNVGEVVDAEQSEGVGIRVTGGDDTGRLKADAGFANSTFTNPAINDPQLTGGAAVVPLQSVNKNAWYAEASYDLLKDIKLDLDRTLSASINVRTERIDPQFGTLGASLQADRVQTQYALNMNIAGATAQFQQNFSEDNLARLSNLLTTNNNNTNISLTFPLQTFLKTPNPLLPNVTYNIQQTQQVGSIASAAGGGFSDPSQIPNQSSTNHQVGLDWTLGDVAFNYKYSTAFQDNLQIGRENADTRNFTHQFSTTWQVNPQLRFNLGYNFVNANNVEQQITRLTNSPTFGVSWEFIPSLLFAFNYNRSDDNDSIGQTFTRGESLEFLLTWNFKLNSLGQELPGSTFIRYGKQSTLNQNSPNNINTNATIDTISAGLSLSF